MRHLAGKVAVVTGAASGIGRSLALRLARERCALALADIDGGRLAETAAAARKEGVVVSTHGVDVADRDAMTAFRDAVVKEHGRAELLVNNAGVALIGSVGQVELADIDWLMGINFWGVLHGVKLFLPLLQQQPEAHIVNLSSIFGVIAPPGQAAYCASKFAVRGFTEALRHELAGSPVKVSTVHPGGIRTPIAANARAAQSIGNAERSELVAHFDKIARTSPERAAERIVQGILRDEKRILIGADARFLDRVQRLFPVGYWQVLGRLMAPRRAAAGD
ncbi:MAG TPA: SDR family oxidoreductase [Stellaceae bacterium]|nr:SDR family oxidoreductase [Stellaceae bacterium]